MIIDAHTHIGRAFWGQFTPEILLSMLDGIDYAVCSNLEGIDGWVGKDEFECNLEMLAASKKYPKLKPLITCEPDRTKNADAVRTLLKEYSDFVGLKLHPEFTKLPADSEKYDDYMKTAEEFDLPCLFHAGHINSKYSSPRLIYKKAKQFPKVKIILGHLSTGISYSRKAAIDIIVESIEKETALLYTDISWVDFEDTVMLIDRLKHTSKGDYTHRIMWASDAPVGAFSEQKNFYGQNLSDFTDNFLKHYKDKKLLENIMYHNAKKLFKL